MSDHHNHEEVREYFQQLWSEYSSFFGHMHQDEFMHVADLIKQHTHDLDKVYYEMKMIEMAEEFAVEMADAERLCRARCARARETLVQKHARIAALIKADIIKHRHQNIG